MRSCKTLRRAQRGLNPPVRSALAANVSRGQHILAGHDNFSENGASTDSHWTSIAVRLGLLAVASFVGAVTVQNQGQNSVTSCDFDEECGVHYETGQHFMNWSSTVSCLPERVYEPKNAQEVVRVLKAHHDSKMKIRPIGQALSPNGLGMSNNDVISLSAIDYVEVDKKRSLVTVGAGAKVSTVLKELKRAGLTLQNFSSIQEQQIGGWMQVAAHGTGVSLPTVEEMVVNMKMATPTEGLITLSGSANPRLFSMAKVGLGSLGVVTEMTLKCIPQMNLLEESAVFDKSKMDIQEHVDRLRTYRHVRYMWVPYTNTVVTVVSNPTDRTVASNNVTAGKSKALKTELPTKPLSDLLMSLCPKLDPTHTAQLSFSQLRDQLLDLGPLNLDHIKKVNKAEAEFWKASEGERLGDSTDILGFDCGGEQLVMEFCFPIGTLQQLEGAPSSTCVTEGKDLAFVQKLLALIEAAGIPAPSPIEQRWTASSSAYMSPAYAASEADQQIFSWVGVIMYLPPNQTEEQRQSITTQFRSYLEVIQPLLEEYDAHAHWAKIEVPTSGTLPAAAAAAAASDDDKNSWFGFLSGAGPAPTPLSADSKIATLRSRLASRYPVKDFNKYREALDPHSILSNTIVDTLISNKVDSQ